MGRAYVIKCPKGQHWATHLNRCEHATLARCVVTRPGIRPAQMFVEEDDDDSNDETDDYYDDDYTYSPTSNIMLDADYKIRDSRCLDKPKDVFHPIQFAHPNDCNAFYKCIDGFGYKVRCPATLHYYAEHNECDYPDVAKCKSAEVVEAGIVEASSEEVIVPKCVKGVAGKIPVEGSFTSYFECVNGNPYLMQCADHELFNPIILACEHVTITDEELLSQILMLTNSNQRPTPTKPNFVDPHYSKPTQPQRPPTVQQRPQMPQMPQIQYPNNYPGMMNNQNFMPDWNYFLPSMNHNQHQNYPQQYPMQQMPNWSSILNPGMNFPMYANNPVDSSDESDENDSGLVITFEKPAHTKPVVREMKEFKFDDGKVSKICPQIDDAANPIHLSHEKEW